MRAQIINAMIGIWLMVAPSALHYTTSGAISNYIVGPILATFALVACWEVTRVLRKVGIAIGVWLVFAPWILGYSEMLPILNDTLCGIAAIIFAFVKGEIKSNYGGGWQALWQTHTATKAKL